jgi:hypothetical protein
MMLKPCPAGQMRKAAGIALPGQTAAAQPCVPIVKTAVQSKPAAPSQRSVASQTMPVNTATAAKVSMSEAEPAKE